MKEPLSDFPEDNPIYDSATVEEFFDDVINGIEFDLKDNGCDMFYMENIYKKMELYYRIKLLNKTIKEQIFGKK